MNTIQQVAEAFAAGRKGKAGSASTDGRQYVLYNTVIAERISEKEVRINWGGFYTATTANHINEILDALGVPVRVSYAKARDAYQTDFIVYPRVTA